MTSTTRYRNRNRGRLPLEEWRAFAEDMPATPNQHGAVMAEFSRLGFRPRWDRDARLAWCAYLLGLPSVGSTKELTMAQAGKLVRLLSRFKNQAGMCEYRPEIPAA